MLEARHVINARHMINTHRVQAVLQNDHNGYCTRPADQAVIDEEGSPMVPPRLVKYWSRTGHERVLS